MLHAFFFYFVMTWTMIWPLISTSSNYVFSVTESWGMTDSQTYCPGIALNHDNESNSCSLICWSFVNFGMLIFMLCLSSVGLSDMLCCSFWLYVLDFFFKIKIYVRSFFLMLSSRCQSVHEFCVKFVVIAVLFYILYCCCYVYC